MESNENRGWYQAEDVRNAARGRWVDVLARLGIRTELLNSKHGPCPGCGGRDRFRFDDKNGEGTFICSQGGGELLSGDGIALLMHVQNWEWKRCIEQVGRLLLPDAVRSNGPHRRVDLEEGVARAPQREPQKKKVPLDLAKLIQFVEGTPEVSRQWVRDRSRFPTERARSEDFLECIYQADERVLIFTNFYSQGEFIYRVGREGYRLAAERGVKAVPSKLPTRGKEGVWFLTNPVTGLWEIGEPKATYEEIEGQKVKTGEESTYSRRSWKTVTDWRYLVLESDEAPENLWLRALVKLALPIAAIYSSGGRSLHALVKINAKSKAEWDAIRDAIRPLVCTLGADPGALSAVRLSRLPGCLREGKRDKNGKYIAYTEPQPQELIFLNPEPPQKPLLTLKARSVQI